MNHSAASLTGRKLRLAVIITSAILIGEVVGGVWANSLALLSDAGHVFTDILALALSWFAVRQAERPPSNRMTFGYHRVGVLIALINAMTLVAIGLFIVYEAVQRFQNPEPVRGGLMLGVALVGLLANLVIVFLLRSEQRRSLSVHSAFLHVVGDALASIAVIGGGITIVYTGWYWVDPMASILIAGVIAFGSWRIIREGISVFLEASPAHLDLDSLVHEMEGMPGVVGVHDLHVWTITRDVHALSCHLLVEDALISEGDQLLADLNQILEERHYIRHTTMQLECVGCDPNELFCSLSPEGLPEPHLAHHHR